MGLEIRDNAVLTGSDSEKPHQRDVVRSPESTNLQDFRTNDVEDYPNVFRTICIVVAVALSLFLVHLHQLLHSEMLTLFSLGRARHGEIRESLLSYSNSDLFLSRPLLRLPYLELPINSAALTLSAGTARRFSSHWHVSSLFGIVL